MVIPLLCASIQNVQDGVINVDVLIYADNLELFQM